MASNAKPKPKPKPRLQGSPAFNRPPPTRTIKTGPERLPTKATKRTSAKPPSSPLAATIAAVRAKNPAPVGEYQARADESWKPPEILRSSLTGRKRPAPEPIVPVETSLEPPRPQEHREMRTRATTLSGLLGAAVSVGALLVLVLHGIVPWLVAHPAEAVGPNPARLLPEGTLTRAELEPMTAGSLYAARLMDWPLAGLIWALIFGAALFGIDEIPRMRAERHRLLQTTLLAALSFAGFLLVLDGCRWLGLYVASLADDGGAPLHLHLFPYLVLGFGAAILLGSGYLLARKLRHLLVSKAGGEALDDVRQPLWTALAATIGLLLLPLLPLLVLDTATGTAYVNEAELDAARSSHTFGLSGIASDYATARGLLWVVFYLAWAGFGLAVAERASRHRFLHPACLGVQAAIALPLLGAAIFALLLQVNLAAVDGERTSAPLILPITLLVLAVLYMRFVRSTFLPFLRHATASLAE